MAQRHNQTPAQRGSAGESPGPLSDLERGLVVGVLIGEGHFGGDGRYPHVTLRMHVRHEALFRRLLQLFPRTRLYGPYRHGGREYYQWMARGSALVEEVLPALEGVLTEDLDAYAFARMEQMKQRYATFLARRRGELDRRGADS